MTSGNQIKVGINGRTFSLQQPGGDASVGIKHGQFLTSQYENSLIFGHKNAKDRFSDCKFDTTGVISDSLKFGLIWEQSILPLLGRRNKLDILYCPSSYCPIQPTPFKCVIAIQDIPSYHGFGGDNYKRFRRTVLPVMVKRADHIVTVSEFTKKDICNHLGVSKDKVSVVYNGVDEIFFEDRNDKNVVELPDEYILFVGAKSERKNLSGVMESFSILKREYKIPHKLVVVGPSKNPTYNVHNPNEDNIESEVIVPDYLSKEELKFAYENASAFIFPSKHESFGLPPLEAAACKTPVVTTRRGAIPEILEGNAEFVNPENSENIARGIHRVLVNPDYATQLVEDAHSRALQFRWEDCIESLYNIVQSIGLDN